MDSSSTSLPIDLVGIGVSVWDVLMVLDSFPQEEQVVRATERICGLGGGVAVAMATAGLLGGRVAMADHLGSDAMSNSIMQSFRDASIDVSCVRQSEDASASVATIWVNAETGSRTIAYGPAPQGDLPWSDRLAELVARAKVLHLNGRHLEACARAIDVAREHDVRVSFDGGAHRYRDEVLPLLQRTDVLIVAEHFAFAHLRTRHPKRSSLSPGELVAFLMTEFACQWVGVTMGERGSQFLSACGEGFHQPASILGRARDTTGCGDVFHGAFLMAMSNGYSLRQCAKFAARVAGENALLLGACGISRLSEPDRLVLRRSCDDMS